MTNWPCASVYVFISSPYDKISPYSQSRHRNDIAPHQDTLHTQQQDLLGSTNEHPKTVALSVSNSMDFVDSSTENHQPSLRVESQLQSNLLPSEHCDETRPEISVWVCRFYSNIVVFIFLFCNRITYSCYSDMCLEIFCTFLICYIYCDIETRVHWDMELIYVSDGATRVMFSDDLPWVETSGIRVDSWRLTFRPSPRLSHWLSSL